MSINDKIVSERLETLTIAALNGDPNAMSDAVKTAHAKELQSITNGETAKPEDIIKANEAVVNKWLTTQKKIMAEGKDPASKKSSGFIDAFKGWMNGESNFSLIMSVIGADKISLWFNSFVESITTKDKNANMDSILEKNKQVDKITKFSDRHGIDVDQFLTEIMELPQSTTKLAQITPEERLGNLKAIEAERTQKAKEEARKAQQQKIEEATELARAVKQAENSTKLPVKDAKSEDHENPTNGIPEKTVAQGKGRK